MSTASHPGRHYQQKPIAQPEEGPAAVAKRNRQRNFRRHGIPAIAAAVVLSGLGGTVAVKEGPKELSKGVHWLDERNPYSKWSLDGDLEMQRVTKRGQGVSSVVGDTYGDNMSAAHQAAVTKYVTDRLPDADHGIIQPGETVLIPKVRGVEPIDPNALDNMLPAFGHGQPGDEPK